MLSKKEKIGITVGVITILGIFAFSMYKQVKKLLNYTLKVKNMVFNTITATKLDFDVFIDFKNNSDIEIVLTSQEYDIYINDKFITTIKSNVEQIIYANSTSTLRVKVDMNPREILAKFGDNPIAFIAKIKEQNLKLVSKFKVKFGPFNIPIEYPYEDKIKNWM